MMIPEKAVQLKRSPVLAPVRTSSQRRSPLWVKGRSGSQSGFTIIESLMAIIVVTLLMVGITPMLAVAVAIRMQARRVEIASSAATSYIDYLRTRPDQNKANHPKINKSDPPENPPAPGAPSLDCNNGSCPTPDLYCVDGDGTGKCEKSSSADMIVQGVAYNKASDEPEDGYQLIVRVYRADAFNGDTLKTISQQSTLTAGSGDRTAPLVQIKTEISTSKTRFEDYQRRLQKSP